MGQLKTIKFRELKQNVHYAIPCKRKNGKEDYITIIVSSENGKDIVYLNNRFMGAYPKKLTKEKHGWQFIIE